jgi:uncharacterized integral membrane protein
MPGFRRQATIPSVPHPPQRPPGSHRLIGRRRPRSRALGGVVWAGVCGTVLAVVALVVFVMQGSRGLKVGLFGADGTVPVVSILLMGFAAAAVVIAVAVAVRLRTQDRRG